MPIDRTDKVDLLGIDKSTGAVCLTISDHLDWTHEFEHLKLLQDKLNSYLRYIESGEMHTALPGTVGRSIEINVVLKYEPSPTAESFLRKARTAIEAEGFQLSWRVLNNEED